MCPIIPHKKAPLRTVVPNLFWHQGPVLWKTAFQPPGWGGWWFQDDSSLLHVLGTFFLLLLHQLHLRSSGIRSWRLRTPILEKVNSLIDKALSSPVTEINSFPGWKHLSTFVTAAPSARNACPLILPTSWSFLGFTEESPFSERPFPITSSKINLKQGSLSQNPMPCL